MDWRDRCADGQRLDRIAAAVMQAKQPLLVVGSAGICDAVARRRSAIMLPPVLAIIGSMSEIAQRQIATLHSHPRITQIYVDVEHILAGNASDYDARIVQALQKGDHCIVHTCNDSVVRHQIDTLCQRWQHESRCTWGKNLPVSWRTYPASSALRNARCALSLWCDAAMATASAVRRDRISYYGEGGAMRSIRSLSGRRLVLFGDDESRWV